MIEANGKRNSIATHRRSMADKTGIKQPIRNFRYTNDF